MIYYKKLQILLPLIILLQTPFMQTAEESKSPEHSMQSRDEEITSYVTKYPHLENGFDILHNIDTNIPTFYNFLDIHIVENDEHNDPNIGEVIEQAEDVINDNMQNRFYAILNLDINAIQQELQNNSLPRTNNFNHNSSDQPIQINTLKTIHHSHPCQFNINTTNDPIFQYVMHYQHRFMNPMIRNWIRSHNSNYITLLDKAIQLNHVPLAAFILDMGIDPNSTILKIISLLGSAVYHQRPEITRLFLAAGARTNVRIFGINNNYETLLTEAVQYNDIATINVLLQHYINLDAFNSVGKNPLLIAVQKQNEELIHILLQAGANPNIPDIIQNHTETHYINDHPDISENLYNNNLANNLPNFNIDTPGRDIYGDTPLMIAVHNNFIDIVQMLIQAGADINTSNIFYGTALQIAQRNNYTEIRDMLFQAGAIQYTPAQRFWPDTEDSFLPPLSSSLDNRNYVITHNTFTENQNDYFASLHNDALDFDELFPTLELANIGHDLDLDDLLFFLNNDNQATAIENSAPLAIEVPENAIEDQVTLAMENLSIQDEVPAAPAADHVQPKIKKRKRLESSNESKSNDPNKSLCLRNKK